MSSLFIKSNKKLPVKHTLLEDGSISIDFLYNTPAPDSISYNMNIAKQIEKKTKIRARLLNKLKNKINN
jgi:hypothetical protein